jgi:hypothetical protein
MYTGKERGTNPENRSSMFHRNFDKYPPGYNGIKSQAGLCRVTSVRTATLVKLFSVDKACKLFYFTRLHCGTGTWWDDTSMYISVTAEPALIRCYQSLLLRKDSNCFRRMNGRRTESSEALVSVSMRNMKCMQS